MGGLLHKHLHCPGSSACRSRCIPCSGRAPPGTGFPVLVHATLCPHITAQRDRSIGSQHPTAAPRSAERSDRHPGMDRQHAMNVVMSWGNAALLPRLNTADLSALTVWGATLHFCVPPWLRKASRTQPTAGLVSFTPAALPYRPG